MPEKEQNRGAGIRYVEDEGHYISTRDLEWLVCRAGGKLRRIDAEYDEECSPLEEALFELYRAQAEQIRLMTFALQLTKKKLSLQVPVRREEHEVGYTEIDPDTITILTEAIDEALDAARQEGGE